MIQQLSKIIAMKFGKNIDDTKKMDPNNPLTFHCASSWEYFGLNTCKTH